MALTRAPSEITLLQIVKACQGLLTEVYRQNLGEEECEPCGYHLAMQELHECLTGVLVAWTLERLMTRAVGRVDGEANRECTMYMLG